MSEYLHGMSQVFAKCFSFEILAIIQEGFDVCGVVRGCTVYIFLHPRQLRLYCNEMTFA